MEIKKGLKVSTDDCFYDLSDGGYLKPEEICANLEDAKKGTEAVKVIKDFQDSCEGQIEGFYN